MAATEPLMLTVSDARIAVCAVFEHARTHLDEDVDRLLAEALPDAMGWAEAFAPMTDEQRLHVEDIQRQAESELRAAFTGFLVPYLRMLEAWALAAR
jgi:hypothetical protein